MILQTNTYLLCLLGEHVPVVLCVGAFGSTSTGNCAQVGHVRAYSHERTPTPLHAHADMYTFACSAHR